MQIARATIVISPENQQVKHDLTPAEALIIAKMHFKGSNGSPLTNIVVVGEARTVTVKAKPAVPAYHDPINGRVVEAVAAVQEVSHPRTQAEEIERLKRKYTGNIKVDGRSVNAFNATFGSARIVLPVKFDEIADEQGIAGQAIGKEGKPSVSNKENASSEPLTGDEFVQSGKPLNQVSNNTDPLTNLMLHTRAELAEIASGKGIEVKPTDNKTTIAEAILTKPE